MTTQYVPLERAELKKYAVLAHPHFLPELVHIDDSAISVMVHLQDEDFITVHINQRVNEIQQLMQISHLSDLLVIDDENVLGVISARDLYGVKPTKICQEHCIDHEEITAAMLMTSSDDTLILNYKDLLHARVGNVVESFKKYSKRYALIVSYENSSTEDNIYEGEASDKQHVLGFIVAAKLAAQLGDRHGMPIS